MTVYADFTYYTNTYLGTAIASGDFSALALRASQVIDRVTFQRAAAIVTAGTDTTTIDKIKMAMCSIAEELQKQNLSNGADGIVSESQGQYSVSFGQNSQRLKSNQSKLETTAIFWLDGTFLMYPGFNDGEYGSEVDTEF